MRILKTKRSALLAVIGVLVVASAAIAYFSSTGSGSGAGSVTVEAREVALTETVPAFDGLGDSDTVTVTATNNGDSRVQSALDVSSIVVTATGADCPADTFTVSEESSTPKEIGAGLSDTIGSFKVTFNDREAVQDNCGFTFTYDAL